MFPSVLQSRFLSTIFTLQFKIVHFSKFSSISAKSQQQQPIITNLTAKHLKPLLSHLITTALFKDKLHISEFLTACFHLGHPQFAVFTFLNVKSRSPFLRNLVLRSLSDHALHLWVLWVFRKSQALGFKCDGFTFPVVIKACCVSECTGGFGFGREVHCVVLRKGFEGNVVVQTCLVDFYARFGFVRTAHLVVDRMPHRDMVAWNALISGYSRNGFDEEAVAVFREVLVKGLRPNESTLASVVPVCSRLGCWSLGGCLKGYAVKFGYLEDGFLIPAFISMYASNADLSTARGLFDGLSVRSVEVWNAMMFAYSQKQRFLDAFEMYCRMLRAGKRPDFLTFVSVIPSCECCGIIQYGESLHACTIKHGLDSHGSVSIALVSMYAKFGAIYSAKFIFDQMPQRDLLSWNTMLSGYVQNGLWDESLSAFRGMQLEGFNPDAVSIISFLSVCAKLKAILLGKSAHAFSLRRSIDINTRVSNSLLIFYSDCHQISSSFRIFHQSALRIIESWNCLIAGCVNNGRVDKVISLLHEMQDQGINLDLVTLVSLLPSFSGAAYLRQGMTVHGYAIKSGFSNDISLLNALVSMYFSCQNPSAGMSLFEAMPEKDLVSWNAIISGCRHHNLKGDALNLFRRMMENGMTPNYISFLNILPVCCSQLEGKSVHAFAVKEGTLHQTQLVKSLMLMYARFGNMKFCSLLFGMGEKRDISLWNSFISANVQTKNAKLAVALFCDLLELGLQPDNITILGLISACIQLSDLSLAHTVLAYVICKGFVKSLPINNALIDLYARCGDIKIAQQLFEQLVEKDDVSCSIMINAYGLHGDGEAALNLFRKMEQSGKTPNSISYLSLLSACRHSSLVEQAENIFSSMERNGISPSMQHLACIVDLLGRTGHLREAFNIVKRLPYKDSASLLDSLLGSCLTQGNIQLGEEIGRLLLEINPGNPRWYVMLHNMYASVGRWGDANKMRDEMEERGLRKMPGFSKVIEMVS